MNRTLLASLSKRPASRQPAWLSALNEDDLQFLKRFLLASGSLKDLAAEYAISYPTIRARLDRLIDKVRIADNPKITDPFERALKLLVAEGQLAPGVARQLLALHGDSVVKGG